MELNFTRRLRELRSRLRGLFLLSGLLRWALELLLYLAAAYLLDRWVLFPQPVRWVLLAGAALFFLVRLRQLVFYPLSRNIGVQDLALAVERRHRELEGTLASAVELAAVAEQPPPDVSPDLLRKWLGEFEEHMARFRFQEVFRTRRIKQLLAVNAVLVAILGTFAVLHAAESGVFLSRLLGSAADWPRRTQLFVEVPGDSPQYRVDRDEGGRPVRVLVAKSGTLPVIVRAEGVVPDEVFLVVENEQRFARAEEIRMSPREEDGRFLYRFRNVLHSMTFHARGGDDPGLDSVVKVEVSAPPTVEKVVATVTPPSYTRLPVVVEERQEFRVLQNTRLDLLIHTLGAVARGTVTRNNDPATEQPLDTDPENPGIFLHSLVVQESGTFNLHLEGENGFQNLEPLDYVVRAEPDRSPSLEIAQPGFSSVEVTERGVVPFRVVAADDYGLVAVDLSLSRFGTEALADVPLLGRVQGAPERGRMEPVSLIYTLDLLTFELPGEGGPRPLAQGETLAYVVRARDNCSGPDGGEAANETRAPARSIEVVSEGEKTRKLADRQLRLKNAVVTLRRAQDEKGQELAALQGGEEGDETSLRDLGALEVDLARNENRARQISRDFSEILDEFVLNRLDPSPTAERLVRFRLDQLETATGLSHFEAAPLEAMVLAHENGQFGQLDVTGNLVVMVGLALQASEEHARKALEAVQRARVTSEVRRRPDLLREASEQQTAFVATYDLLLEKMEEWEDFQEILEQWRSLVEDQRQISRRYENLGVEK